MPDQLTTDQIDEFFLQDEVIDPPLPPSFETDSLIVGDTAVVRLRGDLDHATATEFLSSSSNLFVKGARNVVIDCTDLAFLDAGGLKALVALERLTHQHCGVLTTRHCSEIVGRVIEATALTTVLGVEAGQPS